MLETIQNEQEKTAQKAIDIRRKQLLSANAPSSAMRFEAPTLKNLPLTDKKEQNFNYSLCESVDYQRESLLGSVVPEIPRPQVTLQSMTPV